MARHRFEDNDNDEKWGGPELAEQIDHQPRKHRQDREGRESRPEAEPSPPPQR
ncbi:MULTISPECIES: hypothetical protein [Amycolatopsis]|uniref:Uncharacterized protein n=2 Tax=Amycolatopsis TaxID=1813 RepID=A0A1I3MP56_9PSEU|nr:hypothetical protein [Amycolatopsis sacchari]SFI98495.1 hypothetical protein SAMN05421835_102407 [Amycolatopsis sacchari]